MDFQLVTPLLCDIQFLRHYLHWWTIWGCHVVAPRMEWSHSLLCTLFLWYPSLQAGNGTHSIPQAIVIYSSHSGLAIKVEYELVCAYVSYCKPSSSPHALNNIALTTPLLRASSVNILPSIIFLVSCYAWSLLTSRETVCSSSCYIMS